MIFKHMQQRGMSKAVFVDGKVPKGMNIPQARKVALVMQHRGHEEVHFFYDKKKGYRYIIAIHDTFRGPAVGGFRVWPYKKEWDAINDVLRLSRGMTYKNAAVGLDIGGGKAVGWLKGEKTDDFVASFAKYLSTVQGKYITAEDVGTTVADMDLLHKKLKDKGVCVLCTSKKVGGSGNPSPFTVHGVLVGIELSMRYKMKRKSLRGLTVSLQGLGNVGSVLAGRLLAKGAHLIVTDIDKQKVRVFARHRNVRAVEPDEIYYTAADVFSPCALGGILNQETIPHLQCQVVAGSANNQLEDEQGDAKLLQKRGILYAPDFVINAGGVINAYIEYYDRVHKKPYSAKEVYTKIDLIERNLVTIYKMAERDGITTHAAAMKLAEKRLKKK